MKKKVIDLESIFLMSLRSNQRLRWFLHYDINLVEYLDSKWSKYMGLADIALAMIPKDKINEMVKGVDKERILKMLEKERPDLFKTLTTPNGLIWLEKQIENFRKRFL